MDGIIVAVDEADLDMDVLAKLRNVKAHDYTGTLRNTISNIQSLDVPMKGC